MCGLITSDNLDIRRGLLIIKSTLAFLTNAEAVYEILKKVWRCLLVVGVFLKSSIYRILLYLLIVIDQLQ